WLPAESAQPASAFKIHLPLETAWPHDFKQGNNLDNCHFTASVLLDERNRAPEMELIAQLEAAGMDVTGAKVRIKSTYSLCNYLLDCQMHANEALSRVERTMQMIKNIAKAQGHADIHHTTGEIWRLYSHLCAAIEELQVVTARGAMGTNILLAGKNAGKGSFVCRNLPRQ
ncbi:MAG: hypothetical protein ACRCYV_09490, partial [Aeromonas sp.]